MIHFYSDTIRDRKQEVVGTRACSRSNSSSSGICCQRNQSAGSVSAVRGRCVYLQLRVQCPLAVVVSKAVFTTQASFTICNFVVKSVSQVQFTMMIVTTVTFPLRGKNKILLSTVFCNYNIYFFFCWL